MSDPSAIEDIYPLSPLQAGLLFHTLYAPESPVYFEQSILELTGHLDATQLRRAWATVTERHPVLRTSVVWHGLSQPLQVVRRSVETPWSELDWSALPTSSIDARLEAFLADDQAQGFELTKAPLMRLTLIRTGPRNHRLVWSFHHLLLDGWSAARVQREVLTAYEAAARGRQVALPPTRPYRDHIAWLTAQDRDAAATYWREALAGFGAPTPLGLDRPTAIDNHPTRARHEHLLSAELAGELSELCRRHRVTLNTVMAGAWGLLLSRYSGERDVVFGIIVAGRPPLAGADLMVGLFINTVPLRMRVDPDASAVRWLQALQVQMVDQRPHEHASLVDIQAWSELPRGAPLFETLFGFENFPTEGPNGDMPATLEVSESTREQTNYPLDLAVMPAGDGIELLIGYDARRFEPDSIARLTGHLATLLKGLVAHPERRLSELELLTEPERHQLVVEWNDTAAPFPHTTTIPELLAAQARSRPQALAVVDDAAQLTFGELDAAANRLAHRLRALSVGPEVVVGICLERSVAMVIGLVAILKAGGAYLPLDPDYPAERLGFMLADTGAPVLVTQAHLRAVLPDAYSGAVVDLETDAIAAHPATAPTVGLDPANLAYVIYTSGSTGVPKGVGISHASVAHLVAWHQRAYSVCATDRATQMASAAFDATVWELWPHLAGGASVHVVDPRRRPEDLVGWLAEHAITVSFVPTPMLEATLDMPWPSTSPLRALLTGGDRLSRAPKDDWPAVINHYGPTENTVVTTAGPVSNDDPRPPSIGRPIANTRVYLLDPHLNPVPVGVVGELYTGGAGLARGYLGRPALTAERFVPDPYGEGPGARLYRTGDLARWRPEGTIEFVGRADHQVKVRGYRIELGEIEARLAADARVSQAVVLVREDRPGDRRLVAYVSGEGGQEISVRDLRARLSTSLPDYMVPTAFVVLETMPLTPNAKVDRAALPAPGDDRSVLASGFVAPRTETETQVAGVWSELFGVEVGANDDFFELGGHSLLATQLVARLQDRLGVAIPLRTLFQGRTVAECAAAVDHESDVPVPPPLVAVDRRSFER